MAAPKERVEIRVGFRVQDRERVHRCTRRDDDFDLFSPDESVATEVDSLPGRTRVGRAKKGLRPG